MVTLHYRGTLKELTGKSEEQLEANTLKAVLSYIRKAYGRAVYQEARRMLITIDGESILLYAGLRTKLEAGATIAFFPIAGGG